MITEKATYSARNDGCNAQDHIDHGNWVRTCNGGSDFIRQDQKMIKDEERRWRELDASIGETLVEMNAGGGIDFGEAYDALLAELATVDDHARPGGHPSHYWPV